MQKHSHWRKKQKHGKIQMSDQVALLNAPMEMFSFLHDPLSMKTKGKQRKPKIFRSTRVWFHAAMFTQKHGASVSVTIFILVSSNKNTRIFYQCQLKLTTLLGHTSLLHPFLQTTMTQSLTH